jgi:hypothetical protein
MPLQHNPAEPRPSCPSISTIAKKDTSRRGSYEGGLAGNRDQLQEEHRDKALSTRQEEAREERRALPLISQDDEFLQAQKGAISASATEVMAHAGIEDHDLVDDQVSLPPYSPTIPSPGKSLADVSAFLRMQMPSAITGAMTRKFTSSIPYPARSTLNSKYPGRVSTRALGALLRIIIGRMDGDT